MVVVEVVVGVGVEGVLRGGVWLLREGEVWEERYYLTLPFLLLVGLPMSFAPRSCGDVEFCSLEGIECVLFSRSNFAEQGVTVRCGG